MSESQQFAQLLIADRLIREQDWQMALEIKSRQGGHLLEILMGLCPITEEDLYRSIARQLQLPFWSEQDLLSLTPDPHLLQQFPPFLLLEYTFLPVYYDNVMHTLQIILPNPLDMKTLEAIKLYAQIDHLSDLALGVSTPTAVVNAIQMQYRRKSVSGEYGVMTYDGREEETPPRPHTPSGTYTIAPPKIQLRSCPACGHPEALEAERCSNCSSPLDLAQADPLLHKQVGRFRLTQKLGEGGMGLVYRAQSLDSAQEAAVKILRTHLSTNERVVRRFHREAQAQNQLRHPNIVYVHDFGFEESIGFYIAMEFLKGHSLEDIFEQHPEWLTLRFLRRTLQQVCDAMGFAHSRGIYHRDLKPDNIFLQEAFTPEERLIKILDFGVAKIMASDEDQRLTRTGMTIGTPRYMSPEQAGEGTTDNRSDIYSLGVILFETLTGQPPFEGSSAYQIMLRHVYADPPSLSHVRPDLPFPAELEDLVFRALAKDPQKRPASMDLFWHQLSDTLDLFAQRINPDLPLLAEVSSSRRNEESDEDPAHEDPPVIVGRMIRDDKAASSGSSVSSPRSSASPSSPSAPSKPPPPPNRPLLAPLSSGGSSLSGSSSGVLTQLRLDGGETSTRVASFQLSPPLSSSSEGSPSAASGTAIGVLSRQTPTAALISADPSRPVDISEALHPSKLQLHTGKNTPVRHHVQTHAFRGEPQKSSNRWLLYGSFALLILGILFIFLLIRFS